MVLKQKQFIITHHAKEKLRQRLGTKPVKFMKVVIKAWYSKPIKRPYIIKLEYSRLFNPTRKNIFYRELFGFVFVFAKEGRKLKLITLYN